MHHLLLVYRIFLVNFSGELYLFHFSVFSPKNVFVDEKQREKGKNGGTEIFERIRKQLS